jgi:hypothetical protein
MQQTYIDHPNPIPLSLSSPLASSPPRLSPAPYRATAAASPLPCAPPPQARPGRAQTPPPWRVRGGSRGGRDRIRPAVPPPTARRPLPWRRDSPVKSRGGHSGGRIWSGQRRMVDDGGDDPVRSRGDHSGDRTGRQDAAVLPPRRRRRPVSLSRTPLLHLVSSPHGSVASW